MMPLRPKLVNIAKGILDDEEDAEDAVQETYLRLWNIRTQLDQHPNPQGYAMQTLKNICIDKIRATRFNMPLDAVIIESENRTPHSYTEQQDNVRIIRSIIDSLPELQRRIILMRDVEEYELAEIAEIIGSDATAVRVNLSRARKKVRDKFISINNRSMHS